MSRIITLYNHKGGVSKTTTSFNLAHALASTLKTKVLLVDADPQCNLTELALTRIIEQLDEQAEQTGIDKPLPGTTILDALKPRFIGDRPDVDVDAIQLVQLPGSNVSLLRGDIGLSEAEDIFSQAHSMRTTTDVHQKRNYIAMHDMLRRLAKKHGFSHVFVDVGPSAGALTRTCFLAADAFLVPVVPDRFNFQAVGSLSAVIGKWMKEHGGIVADFQKLALNVSSGQPQFRGIIMQRYQRYAGAPKPAFKHWMQRIPDRVLTELLPALVEATKTKNIVAEAAWKKPIAAEIPEFASLGPMMLTFGKPVWALTQEDTNWVGSVWDERKEAMDGFQALFEKLVRLVEK